MPAGDTLSLLGGTSYQVVTSPTAEQGLGSGRVLKVQSVPDSGLAAHSF